MLQTGLTRVVYYISYICCCRCNLIFERWTHNGYKAVIIDAGLWIIINFKLLILFRTKTVLNKDVSKVQGCWSTTQHRFLPCYFWCDLKGDRKQSQHTKPEKHHPVVLTCITRRSGNGTLSDG